ncbi:MAG: hypothetical protein RIF41_07920, partial [Polyangiaceae bacterium]
GVALGVLFGRPAAAGFFYPAKQAAWRSLVDDAEVVAANALDSATWSAAFAVGTALGGVVALAGTIPALIVDAATFVLAAVVLRGLPSLPAAASPRPLRTLGDVLRDLAVALRTAKARPGLVEAVFAKAPMAFAGGAAWVSLNLGGYELGLLGSGALAIGLVQAVRAVGTGVGPLVAARWLSRYADRAGLLRGTTLVVIAAVVTLGLALQAPRSMAFVLAAGATFVWGVGGGASWVFSNAQMQARASEGTLGRLASLDQLSFTAAQSLAALSGGYLVDVSGSAEHAAWWGAAGGAVLLLGLVTWATRQGAPPASARHATVGG